MKLEIVYFFVITLKTCLRLSEALHLVHWSTITDEMRRMMESAEYPRDDPRNLRDLQSRQRICDEVIGATEYMVKSSQRNVIRDDVPQESDDHDARTTNFQRLRSKSRDTLPVRQKVAFYKDQGNWHRKTVTIIECVRTRKKNWFVGFDEDESRMFLIQRYEFAYGVVLYKWVGLLEERARYNLLFSGPRALERLNNYFLNQVKSDVRQRNLQKTTLCFLTLNEHGRLCSTAAESMKAFYRFPLANVGSYNYVNTGQKRCSPKEVIVMPAGETVNMNVVLCAINREQTKSQFYLVSDRQVPGAVFVLGRHDGKKHVLKIKARLENLNVLLERRPTDNLFQFHRRITNIL